MNIAKKLLIILLATLPLAACGASMGHSQFADDTNRSYSTSH